MRLDKPSISDKLYVLVFQCDKCGRPSVHTYWSKVHSKSDIEATAFTVSCPENCSAPEILPGRELATLLKFLGGLKSKRLSNCQYGCN